MKRILLTLAAVIFLGSPLLAGVSAARDNNVMTRTGKVNPSALREMLTKGLKATRPDEKALHRLGRRLGRAGETPRFICVRILHLRASDAPTTRSRTLTTA